MEKKALLRLLLILLSLSYVVFSDAVPTTRSFIAREVDPSQQGHLGKKVLDLKNGEELFDMEEGHVEGRIMINIVDYPGSGANPAHKPKSPGKP